MRLIDADHLRKWILARWQETNPYTDRPFRADEILAQIDREFSIEMDRLQGWTLCSKKFPDYDETSEYLITDKEGRVRHCCLDLYMPETFVTVEESMIVDAVAWRPAPEPYCKTESHEREGK